MLVEREQQLDLMGETALRASNGHGAVVLVSGEAGIGKTSLVTTFVDSIKGVSPLWGACDDLATPRSFGPLHDMARNHAPLASALTEPGHTEVYETLLRALSPPIGLAVGVIEDAHWADQATLDAIRFVGRRIGQSHGLLLVTARTEAISGDHPLRLALGSIPPVSLERIELEPLTLDGIAALGGTKSVDDVLSITGGNPFFVTELLHSGGELPGSVVDAVLARAAGLGEPERRLLTLVSVVPGECERSLIEAIDDGAESTIPDVEKVGLLIGTPTTARFRHELARRAYESILDADTRRNANREILAQLETVGAHPARLVHHAAQAGDLEAVTRWAPVAARDATAAGAHRQAVEHLHRAVALIDRYPKDQAAELLESLAWELYVVGRVEEAIANAERAVALRREMVDHVALGNALRVLSRVQWMGGRRQESEVNAEEAIMVLEPLGESRDLAFAYSARSQLAMLAAEDEPAIHWGTIAIEMARRLDDHRILSHALTHVG
ncbi:MAG TPA: AAA family ATPase, partial [Acidimicrobiia bacterium]